MRCLHSRQPTRRSRPSLAIRRNRHIRPIPLVVLGIVILPGKGARPLIALFDICAVYIFRRPIPLVSLGTLVILVTLSILVAPGGQVVLGSLIT